MDNTFIDKAVDHAKKATTFDRAGEHVSALGEYQLALTCFMTGLKYEKNPARKQVITERVKSYLDRAEQIKKFLAEKDARPSPDAPAAAPPGGAAVAPAKPKDKKGGKGDKKEEEDEKLKTALATAIVREKPNVRWADVAGLETAKAALREAVVLPLKFPQFFTGKRQPWKGILMYGPPGTGKTYLAKAVATEVDSTFFSISSSDLVSKWQGESEKCVKALFTMAEEEQPSIVFVDEIDALCSARSDNESEASRRIKTEFLVRMSALPSGVLVLGATNIPWGLDSAIRRRFERRIYIPLPDPEARTEMIRIHTAGTPVELAEEHFAMLAEECEGFSGADINIAVREALLEPVRRVQTATHFRMVTKDGGRFWEPCAGGAPGAEEKSLMDIPSEMIAAPAATLSDFRAAFGKVKPSVGPEDLAGHDKFTEEFGSS
jgi:vacuolar protein-sorting-associated protein 4